MVFWLIVAAVLLGASAFLVVPLLRRPEPAPGRDRYETAIYRDQLAEIDRDLERGLIAAPEAQAARTEVSRRLLAVDGHPGGLASPGEAVRSPRPGIPGAGIAVGAFLPTVAVGLYLLLGTPQAGEQMQTASGGRDEIAAQHEGVDMGAAVDRLAERLQQNPGDRDGWILLARTYTTVRRFQEAAAAYEAALALTPGDGELRSAFGEALVLAAGGIVPPRAREAFEAVLSERPGDPRSRYYLGVAEAQSGRGSEAIRLWQALEADSPADAPWIPAVRQQIENTARQYDIAVVPSQPAAARPSVAGAADPGDAGKMSPGGQEDMIRGMVDRLAARLQEQPDDLDGWLRLARSYRVLGEQQKASEALAAAAAAAENQGAEAQQTVEQARRSLLGDTAAVAGAQSARVPPADAPSAAQAEMVSAMVERLAARLQQEPEDAAGWLKLGRSYAVLGEPAKARAAYSEALTRQPGNLALLQSYADTTLETGADGAATSFPDYSLTVLRNLLTVDPGNPQALWLLGLAEVGAGRPQAAAELWQRLLAGLQPDDERFRTVALQLEAL